MLINTPGRLISLEVPILPATLAIIEQLPFEKQLHHDFINKCHDTRLDLELWAHIIQKELLFLYYWAKARTLLKHKSSHISYVPTMVLSLMPRHGLLVHILRRALVFACLGIYTELGCHDQLISQYQTCLAIISKVFKVESFLSCTNHTSIAKVNKFNTQDNFLLMTGHTDTAILLQQSFIGKFIGCTGKCTVVISDDLQILQSLTQQLSAKCYPNSCTNLTGSYLYQNNSWYQYDGHTIVSNIDIRATLSNLHPTAIYQAGKLKLDYLYGYKVLDINLDGSVNNLIGYATDPIFAYPGDFLV